LAKRCNPQIVGGASVKPIPRPRRQCCNRFAVGIERGQKSSGSQSIAERWIAQIEGRAKKQWAMTVNDRWRICFEFRKGDAFDVEIVDYHKG
jgi:hypothetical protein